MFSTWKDDKFKKLYEAVQEAITSNAGRAIVKWNAGDTGVEKEQVIPLTPNYIAAVNAEYEVRWPGTGRRRTTRTKVAFS